MSIRIGTCGYGDYRPPGDWKQEYTSKLQAYSYTYQVVELNRTFYKLPQLKTAQRWRREVAEGFDFTLKAWQAVTHSTDSPTWRKRKEGLSQAQLEEFGNFRPTPAVLDAWYQTRNRASALGASVCVLQCPSSLPGG